MGPDATPTHTQTEAEGRRLFLEYCSSCHSTIPDEIIVGPSLAGIKARAAGRLESLGAREYIRQSIQHPGEYIVAGFDNLMPTSLGQTLSGEEVDAILAYLMTLG